MAAGLPRRHANEFHQSLFPLGNAGDLPAADCPCGNSGRLAAQTRFAGNLLHGSRLEGKRLRPGLHPRASAALARERREHQVRADTERVENAIRCVSKKDWLPIQFATTGILQIGRARNHDASSHVVAERGSRAGLQGIHAGGGIAVSGDGNGDSSAGGHSQVASGRRRIRRHAVCARNSGGRELRRSHCHVGPQDRQARDSPCRGRPPRRRLVCHGLTDGEDTVIRACIGVLLAGVSAFCSLAGTDPPPPEFFQVLKQPLSSGPRITPYLRYQTEQAWKEDEARQKAWEAIRDEAGLHNAQDDLGQKLLQMIGGLPTVKSDLHAEITGKIPMDGFIIEKLVFQSLSGIYVTALVYVPKDHQSKHPAVLVPAGHAADGKFHYQALSQRLAGRGYVVISWDPVGQGERSQFWDSKAQKSRYNLICAEHAVMGNLAYLAGANLARWEIWDGMRAVDYLLTRPDVDPDRISITGTSGGGTQTALIGALDPRIKVIIPSCYISSLPMRMANRIFVDPDSDPEQNQEAAFDFLDRFNRMPIRHELAAPKELPDAELLCTSSGQVMLDQKDARSLLDVIREYYEERKAKSNTSLAKTYRAGQRNVD